MRYINKIHYTGERKTYKENQGEKNEIQKKKSENLQNER